MVALIIGAASGLSPEPAARSRKPIAASGFLPEPAARSPKPFSISSARRAILALAMIAVPRLALACPVCFGQSDSPMAAAANMSIWVMLGVTGVVLAGFAAFIVTLAKRASQNEESAVDSQHSFERTSMAERTSC